MSKVSAAVDDLSEHGVAASASSRNMPTFLLLGSAKCATTSLHLYLSQHPDVFMSRKKECHFFCHEDYDHSLYHERYRPITTADDYRAQFSDARERARGESSPMYLYFPTAAERIKKTLPKARLIAVLRNPADRAFSAYVHMVRDGIEPLSFEQALEAERERMASGRFEPNYAYSEWGYYAEKLRPYFEQFSSEQILVLSHEEVVRDIGGTLRRCCEHIGVTPDYTFDVRPRMNVSGVPKRRWLHNAVQRVKNGYWLTDIIKRPFPPNLWIRIVKSVEHSNLAKLRINPVTRQKLLERYRDDAGQLTELTGKDFSSEWF